MSRKPWTVVLACILSAVAVGCGGDDDDAVTPTDGGAPNAGNDNAGAPNDETENAGASNAGAPGSEASAGDAQTPPTTNAADLEAWLKKGAYKSWACETVEHPQLKVSPHGRNRVCSNDLTLAFFGKAGDERPLGTAAVKELYNDSAKLVGYAVAVKVEATSDDGKGWYWYESTPSSGVVADGLGDSGTAKSICVGCHAAAGSDDTHSLNGSGDYVYLQASP